MPVLSTGKELLIFFASAIQSILLIFYQIFLSAINWILPTRYKNIGDDIILITGGGRGLGRALALELAKYKPKHIILWGRHSETLSSTCKEVLGTGVSCTYMVCDVSDRKQVYQQAECVLERIGTVSILVNNAGIVYGHPILESRDEDIEKTINVNAIAHFWTTKAFLPAMVAQDRGHLVAMSSVLGLVGLSGAGDYSASKSAIAGLAESLLSEVQNEVKKSKIKITVAYPYQVDNDMFAGCKPRFPSLFPPISEEYVAEKCVHAILTDQVQVLMPRMMYLLWFVKTCFPVNALLPVFQFLGVDKAMSTFEGGVKEIEGRGNR